MKRIILDVEPFQETLHADMCGPAALKIVLAYYGVEKTERELAQLCSLRKGLGTDANGIRKAAEELGFTVRIKDGSTFSDIAAWLKKGVPVIVDWFTRGRLDYDKASVPDGHYSPVIGLDGKHIYLQDPELGSVRKISRDDFIRAWFDFSGAVVKPEELIVRQLIAIYKKTRPDARKIAPRRRSSFFMKHRTYANGFAFAATFLVCIGIAVLVLAGLSFMRNAHQGGGSVSISQSSESPNSRTLNASNRGLVSLPMSIFDQSSLETLDVSHNALTGALPAEIRHLSSLRTLNASYNHMTGVPAEIGQLQNLEYLDLSYNQLTGLPQELGNLQHLRVLNLAGNPNVSSQDLAYIRAHLPQTTQIILN